MKILKINNENYQPAIKEAVKLLKQGGVLVYPTETSYGLGGDATKRSSLKKIFKIKKRKPNKAVTVLVADFTMAKKYGKFDKRSWKLAKKYWPGPLTLVLAVRNQRQKVFLDPVGNNKTLGMRISPQPLATQLVKELKRPLVTTSANLSGQPAAYSTREIIGYFKNKKFQPDLILDAGRLPKTRPSTVIKIENKKIKILRPGPLKISLD